MKKLIYYLTFYFLVLSCVSNENVDVNCSNKHCPTFVSREEAINEVTSLLEDLQINTKATMREIDQDNSNILVFRVTQWRSQEKQILGITISTTTSFSGGHAWVIDQLLKRHRTRYAYSNGEVHPVEQYQYLVHCNMGWHGLDNGYYFSGKFDTNDGGYITDITKDFTKTTSEGEDNYYQFKLQMNVGITNPVRYE